MIGIKESCKRVTNEPKQSKDVCPFLEARISFHKKHRVSIRPYCRLCWKIVLSGEKRALGNCPCRFYRDRTVEIVINFRKWLNTKTK